LGVFLPPHYRFGNENQILYWETETRELLVEAFEGIRGRLQRNNGLPERAAGERSR
jgi:hypothetical protein